MSGRFITIDSPTAELIQFFRCHKDTPDGGNEYIRKACSLIPDKSKRLTILESVQLLRPLHVSTFRTAYDICLGESEMLVHKEPSIKMTKDETKSFIDRLLAIFE